MDESFIEVNQQSFHQPILIVRAFEQQALHTGCLLDHIFNFLGESPAEIHRIEHQFAELDDSPHLLIWIMYQMMKGDTCSTITRQVLLSIFG